LNIEHALKKGNQMTILTNPAPGHLSALEALVENTCFCKLRSHCPDKNSAECMKHKNIYVEFMQEKHAKAGHHG
jgi:hypothetical protein